MDDFNEAAARQEAYSEVTKKIMATIDKTRLGLALIDATAAGDWAKATSLVEQGADTQLRNRAAIIEVAKHDSIDAQRLLEKMKVPYHHGDQKDASFVLAAKNGNLATVEDTLTRDVPAKSKSRALHAALFAGQDAIADLLLQKMEVKDFNEKALFALLARRPAEFERVTAGRTERHNLPDFTGYLYHGATVKDHVVMARALDKMIENKEKMSLYKLESDYDGAPYSDFFFRVAKTGDEEVIGKLLDNFAKNLPSRHTLLSIAANMSGEYPQVLPLVVKKLAATPEEIESVIINMNRNGTTPAIKYFIENWPQQAKDNSATILIALAGEKDGAEFMKAVTEQEIPLPPVEKNKTRLIAQAVEKGSAEVQEWLLKNIPVTPDMLKDLQGNSEYAVQKKAVELGGTMRFNNDSLFWNAAQRNDRPVIDTFPRDPKISTETTWRVGYALEEIIKHGDMALYKDVLDNAAWTEDSRRQVFRTALKSQDALEIATKAGFLPPVLKENDLHDIIKTGPKMMDWLENNGLALTPDLMKEGLRISVLKNSPAMIEHLMAKGADPANGITSFNSAIEYGADEATMATVEKWRTRGEKIAVPDIAKGIEAATDLFSGTDSVAVRAAYADGFASVMKKAAATPGFNPQVLVETKDKHGNSVLEILGAHGRLNDILQPVAVWKNIDAVAFIEANTPKPYHAKVDYHGLKAALDLLKLQEGAKGKRFKLG